MVFNTDFLPKISYDRIKICSGGTPKAFWSLKKKATREENTVVEFPDK